MKVLVANLGSTSFKYRLFDLERPGRAGAGARRDRADRLGDRQGRHQVDARRARAGLSDRRPRRSRAAVPRPVDRPRDRRAARRRPKSRRSASRRSTRGTSPACTSWTRPCWPRWKPSPTSRRPTIRLIPRRCGCSRAGSPSCRWSPRSRPAFTGRFPRQISATPSPTSGRPSSASGGGGSTAPATATSRAGCPSCWVGATSR